MSEESLLLNNSGHDGIFGAVVIGFVTTTFVLLLFTVNNNNNSKIKKQQHDPTIPTAPGYSFWPLGHALSYKKDPVKFILKAHQQVGPIFRINLAGTQMVVLADSKINAMDQVMSKSPESVVSARKAVAKMGFDTALGNLNVFVGTSFHKPIMKHHLYPRLPTKEFQNELQTCIHSAIQQEVNNKNNLKHDLDWFVFLRRVILRVSFDHMIHSEFLQQQPQLLDQFMYFQDKLEDAIATAAVLPKWIAKLMVLNPVQTLRLELEQQFLAVLKDIKNNKNKIESCGWWLKDSIKTETLQDIAHFMIALNFAAHKNVSIACSQTYTFMKEYCSVSQIKKIEQECIEIATKKLLVLSGPSISSKNTTMLAKLITETLRITAHTLGAIRLVQEQMTIQGPNNDNKNGKKVYYTVYPNEIFAASHICMNVQNGNEYNTNFDLDNTVPISEQATFSYGIHACPGQSFAIVLMQLTLADLIANYDIEFCHDVFPPISFERATLAQRAKPIYFEIKEKQN